MDTLIKRIQQIHDDCHKLCHKILGSYLDIAGNIGIFCQNDHEYAEFLKHMNAMTKTSNSPNQKYYELLEPIIVNIRDSIPEASYTYLYIRKPDTSPYGKYLGDIDFIMDKDSYEKFKKGVIAGKYIGSAEVYNRPNWDTIQITDLNITSVAYVCTKEFAEKVRVKFD